MAVAFMADVRKIRDHPDNPRKSMRDIDELAASIREHGVLQAIVVSPDMDRPQGHYLLHAGHRRLAAVRKLGWKEIPSTLKRIPTERSLEVMLVENLQRNNLTPMEIAEALDKMRKLHTPTLSQQEMARRLGKSPAWVSQQLLLLELDDEDQAELEQGDMLVGEARELGRVRKAERKGKALRVGENRGWHFSRSHRLAEDARLVCDVHGHSRNHARRLAATACGGCWELTIRADERGGTEQINQLLADVDPDVDQVVIDGLCQPHARESGETSNPAEKLMAMRKMLATGVAPTAAAQRCGLSQEYVARALNDLARWDAALATYGQRAS